ncbi:MAG: organomercurial lyase [Gemmatimonadaceae bacterium]
MSLDATGPAFDARVRSTVYELLTNGTLPRRDVVAACVRADADDVAASLERLAAERILVLDATTREVWMAMPFSAVPTPFVVEADGNNWWANCAWDALGIAAAVHRDVRVSSACADCGHPLSLTVSGGQLTSSDGVAHFAVPAADWWRDIGYT